MICCINTCTHKCILTPPPPLTLHRILSLSVCQRSKCRLALQRLRVSAAAQFGFSLFTAGAKEATLPAITGRRAQIRGSSSSSVARNPQSREDQCDASSWYRHSQQPFTQLLLEVDGPDSSSRPGLEAKTQTSPLRFTHLQDRLDNGRYSTR